MQKRLIALVVLMLVGAGSASAATTRPRNTGLPTTSGVAKQGEVVTADPGTWRGTQPITFTYQWRRCDTNGANCATDSTDLTFSLISPTHCIRRCCSNSRRRSASPCRC